MSKTFGSHARLDRHVTLFFFFLFSFIFLFLHNVGAL